jgi:phosphate transport system substrate-binding protein
VFPRVRGPLFLLILAASGCGAADDRIDRSVGLIRIDGSSTVYPLTEAVVEDYRANLSEARVTIGVSGTGGGFEKFVRGESDICDASRPIKASEVELSSRYGVEFIELPVAYDVIVVAVNSANTWCRDLTLSELRRMWEPAAQARIRSWSQIRPHWPDTPIRMYGPGLQSGTYDYFTSAVVGTEGFSRGDFVSSEDDNILVLGVAGDVNALGFFSYSYLAGNRDRLRPVAIDVGNAAAGDRATLPTRETISRGLYRPLSRPVFLYVRVDRAREPAVRDFVEFYIRRAGNLAGDAGLFPLSDGAYNLVLERFRRRVTGSAFGGQGSRVGASVEEVLEVGED